MNIHLARDGAALGIFTESEVREGLASRRFLPTDLAWREGMPAWRALAEWTEFTSPVQSADRPVSASLVPWEAEKSPGSFLATLRQAIVSPATALAGGRYAFGDWIAFAYVAVAIALPFQLAGTFLGHGRNQQMADLLENFGLDDIAHQVAAQPDNLAPAVIGGIIGTLVAPLSYAVLGLLLWVFLRMFGHKVPIERTVSASLLATALVIVLMAPLNLLGFSFILQVVVGLLAVIPGSALYYRALGGATGLSPWALFGINMLLLFVLCCCCCVLPLSLLGMAAAAAH